MEDYLNIDPNSPVLNDNTPVMKDCPECDGYGYFDYSDCCDAPIKFHDICSYCGEHCEKETCETCKGTGQVEDN